MLQLICCVKLRVIPTWFDRCFITFAKDLLIFLLEVTRFLWSGSDGGKRSVSGVFTGTTESTRTEGFWSSEPVHMAKDIFVSKCVEIQNVFELIFFSETPDLDTLCKPWCVWRTTIRYDWCVTWPAAGTACIPVNASRCRTVKREVLTFLSCSYHWEADSDIFH